MDTGAVHPCLNPFLFRESVEALIANGNDANG